jgi:hypothetical protein
MSQARRTFLRDLMALAWDLYRSELHGPEPRTFADALAGAWRWMKRKAERIAADPRWAKGSRPRTVAFGTMLQSPIRRSLSGQAYADTRAREAGYLTSMVGR